MFIKGKNRFIAILLLLFVGCGFAGAQSPNPHRIRIGYSDGLWLHMRDMSSFMLSKYVDPNSTGSLSIGYRYINKTQRWGFGTDLNYINLSGSFGGRIFSVMPAVDCYYKKSGICRLYGTANIGVGFTSWGSEVMYQINPIAVRIGTDKIAGFLETGFGHKGFFTLGIEIGL